MNVVVTGAGRGIGYATCLELASRKGIQVFAISRNAENLEKLNQESLLSNPGAKIIPTLFDIETGDFSSLVKKLEKANGSLDILINNAATIVVKPFEQLTEADFQRTYQVNVIRVAGLIQALLPLLQKSSLKKAHILNISSMGGFQGSAKFAGLSAYSSSKSALTGLSECLAEEFKEKQVSVNCLCLGAVQTEMLAHAFPGYEAPVKPGAMAKFIADFAVDAPAIMNGMVVPVSLSNP
jgi:NAD(P)-dependent dehydrogenase (short-subunit alcohol dehydrogenase family)